jgi:hypothetical protein
VEFFRLFEGVPVFEDVDFRFLVDIVLLDRDFFDDVNEILVDLREIPSSLKVSEAHRTLFLLSIEVRF